jgi:hypothetical protein
MPRFFLLILGLCLFSCNQKKENTYSKTLHPESSETITAISKKSPSHNALKFINDYVENSNKIKGALEIVEWTKTNKLSTNDFKKELEIILIEARKNDPTLGLGFDPILDAQDYPNTFELDSTYIDEKYLIVKGKMWPEFKLTMKIIKEKDMWMIDGCGIVNIPSNRRIER